MKIKLVLLGLLILFAAVPLSQGETVQDSGETTVTTTVHAIYYILIASSMPLTHPTDPTSDYTLLDDGIETITGKTDLDVYTNVIGSPTLVAFDGDDRLGVPTNQTDTSKVLSTTLRVGSSDLTGGETVLVVPVDLPNTPGTPLFGSYALKKGLNPLQLDVELDTTWDDAPGTYEVNVTTYGTATY